MRFPLTLPGGGAARVYAYTGGQPLREGRPLLVFVHGAQHDHSVWALQSRALAHGGYNVLAFDLPGHGQSDGPPLSSVPAIADWLTQAIGAAMAAAGLTAVAPTVVIGHSMGSLVALELAGSQPDAGPAGIALLATAIPMRVSDALLAAARDDEAAAFDMINFWSSHGINHRPGCPGPGFSVFNQNRRLMERQSPGVLLNDFSACNAYDQGLQRAASLRCPALFVLAEQDQMTPPRAARKAIDASTGATTVTVVRVTDAGHNLMAEQPDATLEALRHWLRTLPLTGADHPGPSDTGRPSPSRASP